MVYGVCYLLTGFRWRGNCKFFEIWFWKRKNIAKKIYRTVKTARICFAIYICINGNTHWGSNKFSMTILVLDTSVFSSHLWLMTSLRYPLDGLLLTGSTVHKAFQVVLIREKYLRHHPRSGKISFCNKCTNPIYIKFVSGCSVKVTPDFFSIVHKSKS